MFRFETLDIWQLAIKFCNQLYRIADKFPKTVQYNLGSQLRSAALSIPNNIAEGSGSSSQQEFKNFLNYAVRSAYETVSILYIARDNDYVVDKDFENLYDRAELLVKKIRTFRKVI